MKNNLTLPKQTIALIGATGYLGSALAHGLSKGRHRLLLKAADSTRLGQLVAGIRSAAPTADVEASTCPAEACWEADVIILALPPAAAGALAPRIREVANQKIVAVLDNSGRSGELPALLPHSRVVRISTVDGVSGADREAAATVRTLLAEAGLPRFRYKATHTHLYQ